MFLFRNIVRKSHGKLIQSCFVGPVLNVHFYRLQHLNYISSTFANITSCRQKSNLSIPKTTSDKNKENEINSYCYRTHTCGQLRSRDVGKKVTLCGWVQYLRMSKFLLLRDSYGITQCLINTPKIDFSMISLETVITIEGIVASRPTEMFNKDMLTGEIEVVIESLQILNTVGKLPFNLRDYQKPKEQLRMQHRYIDLRFPEMQHNLRQRSLMLHNMRRFLVENKGFVEVETPTLFCRTPGGAREFVVPTRQSELFYSLVQSPQQFKQMLMIGGIDRYFQVARCYRDETTRPDRQPEFTQLDIELSFTTLEGVLSLIEELMYSCYLKPIIKPPFKRMTYKNAMETYGTDKPDLQYELKLKNVSHLFPEKSMDNFFSAFLISYPKSLGKLTAKSKDRIRSITKRYSGTKVVLNENLTKELGTAVSDNIIKSIGDDEFCITAVGDKGSSCLSLGEIRCLLATLLKENNTLHINSDVIEPLWVIDFPLFLKGDDGKIETCHHPFTAPHPDDMHLLDDEPLSVRSLAYDLVMNGNEIGGGSVRIHNSDLQEKVLKILDIDSSSLSHFMNALKSGCPPHAGIALGIDRLMAVTCGSESIRDVIAFPKSHEGNDPLSGAPNIISEDDKKYYNIKCIK